VTPKVVDDDAEGDAFTWQAAAVLLDGLPGGAGLNIAHEAVDRHAEGPTGGKVAFRFLRRTGETRAVRFAELGALTARFANVLDRLGVGPADRVFTLLGRVPELYMVALGTLKHRSVFCPLFSTFGPEPRRTATPAR
jgi:acetyl-CoA synthetase